MNRSYSRNKDSINSLKRERYHLHPEEIISQNHLSYMLNRKQRVVAMRNYRETRKNELNSRRRAVTFMKSSYPEIGYAIEEVRTTKDGLSILVSDDGIGDSFDVLGDFSTHFREALHLYGDGHKKQFYRVYVVLPKIFIDMEPINNLGRKNLRGFLKVYKSLLKREVVR